jgi:hypothetical protein
MAAGEDQSQPVILDIVGHGVGLVRDRGLGTERLELVAQRDAAAQPVDRLVPAGIDQPCAWI